EGAADVPEDEEHREDRDDDLLPHGAGERVYGPFDEPRPVVGGHDANARRQRWLEFLDLVFDSLGDGERVFAVPHQDDAAADLAAILLEDAPAELLAELHHGDIPHADRGAARIPAEDGV